MKRIKAFIDDNGKAEKIELLPYHEMGGNKYSAIGRKMKEFKTPTAQKIKELESVFE